MSTTVAPGDVLAGKFRVERVLGKGGMGMVVAAVHLQLEKRVALKFLLPEMAQNPELRARFARESRAASRIESEHVAKVLDVGALDDGSPYMVMEYLEGQDLAQTIKTRGALPGQEAIEYVLQACEALAEAHVGGIVHRDLKPANLFLTRRADGSPCIKVLDFGISKIALASDQGQGMTQTSALMGSPNYMAPEQLRSARNVDARTDIWSLGIILHELLTGDVAFKADTVPELYVSILQSPPIPLRSRRPDAPPAMEAIVSRCLEKDPARRFANVAELAAALADFAPQRARLSVERITRIVGAVSRPPHTPPGSLGAPAPSTPPPAPSYAAPPSMMHPGAVSHAGHPGHAGHLGGVTPPGAYGPMPGYGAPIGPPGRPMYPPAGQPYAAAPQRQPMSSAQVALLVIVAVIVLGGGTCVSCLCLAAGSPSNGHRRGAAAPAVGAPGPAAALGEGSTPLGAFQRPAGWTTVSRGARSRPPTDSHEGWETAQRAQAALVRRGRPSRGARHRRVSPRRRCGS